MLKSQDRRFAKILIVQDADGADRSLSRALGERGYAASPAGSATHAVALLRTASFDVVVIDDLADVRPQRALRTVRAEAEEIPVIVVATPQTADVVEVLEGGADDYLAKPYDVDELCARIRARLREARPSESETLEAGDVRLDLRAHRCTVDGRTVDLTIREFDLAAALLRHPNQVLTRTQLLAHIWSPGVDAGSNVIDVLIGFLRRKLDTDAIHTVRGIGYRLAA